MSLFQMSVQGAVLIAVVVLLRALMLRRLPKATFVLLWQICLVRLLVPASLPSGWSIYTLLARRDVPVPTPMPTPASALPASTPLSPVFDFPGAGLVWGVGAAVCALVFFVSYVRCRREFAASLPAAQQNVRTWLAGQPLRRSVCVRVSDRIDSPLTFGIIRPVILMPKSTDWDDEATLSFVLSHEMTHIRRLDGVTKLMIVCAVCIHWFNPLVWVLYFLANRDIELSCDEAVIRRHGERFKAGYARALLRMEERRSAFTPLCSHFCKHALEERIESIMKMKKATAMSLVVAALLVTGTVSVFATSEASSPAAVTSTVQREAVVPTSGDQYPNGSDDYGYGYCRRNGEGCRNGRGYCRENGGYYRDNAANTRLSGVSYGRGHCGR